jgi:hypothetical protein
MHIIVLSCWQATYFSAIKSFRKLSLIRRIQLWMHLRMCKDCHEFDHQSELIDTSLSHLQKYTSQENAETLSEEKKAHIKNTINQKIK